IARHQRREAGEGYRFDGKDGSAQRPEIGGRPHARELLRRGCVTEEEGRCPEKEARDRESAHDRPDPGATLRYYSKISHPEITGRIGYSEASSGPRRSELEGVGAPPRARLPRG